ncbi:MAG: alanine dehydrogenase [Myxococcota bacterium]
MIIGCPSEIKVKEYRVGLVPAAVKALTADGHTILIQKNAGIGSGISNEQYQAVGAEIIDSAEEVWERSQIICKVKEPVPSEYPLMRAGQILYTYLHLAANIELTEALLAKKVSAVAYETIQVGHTLPLLKPMSEVAGRMSIQVGAWCLEKHQGGKGLLLGGVTGVPRAKVTILGGGVVGLQAAKVAIGMGAVVRLLDTNTDRLEYLDHIFSERLQALYSTPYSIAEAVMDADLVIGAVLIAGAKAPKLVTRELIGQMGKGSAIVDVAVDQGGCVETMRPTTHDNPIFEVDGIIHYGVANMPGAVARTSTFALAQATLPYLRLLAGVGLVEACKQNPHFALGLNTHQGYLTYEAVAHAHGLAFHEYSKVLAAS